MKANPEKSHFLLSFETPKKSCFGVAFVESSSTEKLPGIHTDSDRTFDEHISSKCDKVGKTNVLSRLVNYMSFHKPCMVMKAFIGSQLNYCPLIWMFNSRTLNNKINRLCERVLRIVHFDYKSSLCGFLGKDISVSIHHKNNQSLAIIRCKSTLNKEEKKIKPPFSRNVTTSVTKRFLNLLDLHFPKS